MTTHRSSYLENISNFYVKGTRDLLLLMKLASRAIPRLTRRMSFVIRAWAPPSYVSKLKSIGLNIEVIDHPLSRVDALSNLARADLVTMPCHSTPTMALIEAASKGVPVITNDVWANSEYVADGQTGFLVKPPKNVRYQDESLTPLWYRPGFIQSLRSSMDAEYLNRHLRALEYLAEDENGLAALQKKTSDHFLGSPFDVSERNRRIGTLLDQAN